ncbi:hypothetical protein QYF36_023341 [Acer negundo]|nr:hypothetical protein QYF36_023341 [Acer negundo]
MADQIENRLGELEHQVDGSQHHQVIDLICGSGVNSPTYYNPFVLSFTNLSYSVKTRPKIMKLPFFTKDRFETKTETKLLLDSISGGAREGEITAVLGASGSGKSTLMDALAGRIEKESLKGSLTLNGKVLESRLSKAFSAYVMQDDLLFPMLTVEETLMFSAEFRLPRSVSKQKKQDRVRTLIDQLGLQSVAKNVIGDEGHRGVSGGERRRVSIGVDIIHDPILLFLDEPTSGLDSSSSFAVVKVLQQIAKSGSILIMSIHQPSYRIVSLLDNLIFLSNGQTVYSGKPTCLLQFFIDFGHPVPENENPTEFALDLICELRETPGGINNVVEFNKSWQGRKNDHKPSVVPLKDAIKSSVARGKLVAAVNTTTDYDHDSTNFANPFWIETIVIAKRLITNSTRMPEHFGCRLVSVLVSAFILATLYWKLDESPKGTQGRLSFLVYIITTVVFINISEIPAYLQERYIFIRETAYNAYRHSSYVLAQSLVSIPYLIILSLAFSTTTFWAVGLHGGLSGFYFFFIIIFASFWSATAYIAFITGLVSDYIVAFTIVVSTFGYFSLYSGFYIARQEIPPYWIWFHYLSLVKYPYQAVLQSEYGDPTKCFMRGVQVLDNTPFVNLPVMVKLNMLQCMSSASGSNITSSTCVIDGMKLMEQRGVTDISKWNCFWITVACGFFFRFMFYLTLLFGSKNKRM